jgi:trans-2,3-dihydro-3-hydroxyanthranilate isomerase
VVELETGAGLVPVVLERDEHGSIVFGRMRQPVPTIEPVDQRAVLDALGVPRAELPVELYDNGARHIVVVLDSVATLGSLRPAADAVAALGATGLNAVVGTGASWRSRMFWEGGEDAATGSAAGPVACHLARHGAVAWGEEIVIVQGVEMGRPSTLHARADGRDGSIEAVEVGGGAVVVARGEFRL